MDTMDDAESKLQFLWNKFLSLENDYNEKKTWLDYFLAHLLLESQTNRNIIDKLEYDVPEVIAREFISEVQRACSESNETDELAPIRKYFLEERGWRCLAVLQLFRYSKLRSAFELSNLLISLYAVVEYEDCLGCEKTITYLLDNEQKSIDDVVQDKLNTIKRKTKNFLHKSSQKKNFNLSKYEKRLTLDPEIDCKNAIRLKSLDSDSLDQDVAYTPKLFLSPLENTQPTTFLFAKHNQDICSSTDSVFHTKSEDSIKLEQFQNDAIRQLFDKRINCLEFRSLILILLQRLCEGDSLNIDEYEEVISSVTKFTLENLCVVQYRFYKQDHASIEILRSQLAYLLITCANGAKKCNKIIDSLSQNGVVQIFLQLLQEVCNSVNKCEDSVAVQRNLDFLYSLLYSIVNLFFQILRQENITKNLCTFNKLYRQFIGCSSGRLIENIIKTFLTPRPYVDRSVCIKRVKIIVTFFGLLIVRFKKLRRKVNRFEERRSSRCDGKEASINANMYNHHDNLFGKAYKALILSPSALHENCCITSTFVVLLKIVLEDADEELTTSVLRILLYCGCCCCVPVHWFLPKLLKSLINREPATRNLILLFFERKFYADIGMSDFDDCPLCKVDEKTSTDRWKYLDEYKSLLMQDDSKIVRTVGGHLLKIFGNFHHHIQRYLITNLIGSLFRFAEKEYSRSKSAYKDAILVCLSLFGDINVYGEFSAEIDDLLQIKDVRNLLQDGNFTELCSRILETRIMCKLSKLESASESFTPVLLESCTTELTVLMKSFDDYYEEVMKTMNDDNSSSVTATKDCKDLLDKLKAVTCTLERLIVRSSVIKLYFRFSPVKEKFQNILFLILKILSKEEITPTGGSKGSKDVSVDDVRLKLTQPLLVICLCLFDHTSTIENRVKELLNDALKAGKISIKQVCDSLLSLERMENFHKEEWNCPAIASIFENELNYDNDGYEADDEVISWSNVENAFSEVSEEDGDGLVSLLDNCSKSSLLYPTICTIAVDLINALKVDQCTEETLYCLHHITVVCKKNPDICLELTKHGVASKLLDKLQESLAEELLTPEETDVQYAITQFLAVLFYYRVERDELAKFFDFLRITRAPFDHLLTALLSVVNKTSSEAQPSYYLSFPVTPMEQTLESDDPAEALALSMREIQKHASVASPWVVCGLTLPLNTNLDWCIWLTGFSTSFWLKYTPASGGFRKYVDRSDEAKYRTYRKEHEDCNNDDMIHIISVGYDTLLLETWVDESTCCFVVRLARPEGNTFEILSQATFQKPLDDGNWHHVVLNVKDTMKQQKIALEISLTIDGLYEETRYLIFLGIFMRKVRPACIMVGDTRTSLKSRYTIGNFMMFRAAILSKECCLTIRAYGPDAENVITCSANGSKPNFVDLMCSASYTIPNDFSVTRLIKQFDENMKQMQDNVLITFSPRNPEYFHYFTQNDVNNPVSVSMFPPATPALFKKTKYYFRINQRVSRPMKTVILASMAAEQRKTFSACIQELGGFPFLAYLFAKLVQSCQLEGTQGDALRLMLKSCFSDVRLCSQFHSYSGYIVISKVLTSSNFKLGRRAFAELTNAMCSQKNYFVGDLEELHLKTDVFICNPDIITNLLLPLWQQWEKADPNLMITLFRGLHSLILGTNLYKQLNMEQLISVNIIEKTLDMCKEKFVLEEKSENVNRDLCAAILGFIKTMIGTPPSSDHVKSIIDYLFVVHPTSHSFCTHSASGFYFLFSSLSQGKFKRSTEMSGTLGENGGNDDDDDESVYRLSMAAKENLNGRRNNNHVPYSRSLSKSLVDLQEKRQMINDFLRGTAAHMNKSEEEEKATDSGIGVNHANDEPSTQLCSFGSLPQLTETDGEYGASYFVPEVKTPVAQRCSTHFYKYISPTLTGRCNNNFFASQTDANYKDECNQYIISTGLLNLIHDTILVLPDSLIGNIFKNIIDYKLFLIMANHPNVTVRNAVVKTLLAWLVRCDEEETVKFVMQMKGFYHLANQLSMYSANEELVNSCISLMARCHWDALDQVDEMEDLTLPSLHFSALPPLLAIFPGTLHDVNLALSVVRFFRLLINKVPQALKKLIENGIVESLVKTILLLIHSDGSNGSIEGNSVLLNDIIDLFSLIMSTCVQTPGVLYLQILNEIVYKCRYLEVTEEAVCGMEEECVQIIHNLHCSVLKAGLDTILQLIDIYHSQDFMKGRRSPSFLTSMTGSMSASLSSIPSSIMSFASSAANKKHLPRSELIDRYKLLINRATEYLQFSSSSVVTDKDVKFACHLFATLINGVSNIVQNKPYIRIGSPWSSVFWSARETLRNQASHLLIWMLAPVRPVHLRMHVIEVLINEPKAKDIISTLVFINAETEQRFTVFLWHLMYSKSCDLSETDAELCEDFKNCVQEWEIVSPQAIGTADDRWQFEVSAAMRELSIVYWGLEKGQQDAVYKCVYKWESLSKKISETAISISAAVSERQGKERKKLLNGMRDKYRLHVEARTKWRQIVQQMTHERAPWFDPDSYPDCWELDPTEGPARVRKRLKRCRLNIDRKYFKQEYANKIKDNHTTPLAYLFENNDIQSMYTVALDSLSMDDTITHMCYATNVQPSCEFDGELLIGAKNLYFIATHISENVAVAETDQFSFIVKFEEIKEIHNRRFQLKERAIEIFLLNGKTYLIAFNSQVERDNFITALGECSLPNRIVSDMLLSDAVDKWKEGHILNWEYLKTLNKMAGRSYNDLMQYPIMPFILADYKSETIDIKDPKIYRNLSKPMAVQDKKKEIYFVNHYNYLKNESTTNQNIASLKQQPYHYASHYSNSGTVLHFLLRLPPYTQIFLQYQDNNFDLPDRTFHSLETTWRLTSSESTTDVKELIPEFFYLPEFLLNLEGFNFGVRQNGEMVDNVKLPSWANGDARLFILVHRQILESEYVRENLSHWIDLVFGYKQTGKEAIDAINVFHPATYYGFDSDSIPDSLEKAAWETMVKTYGQTPRQLFRTSHPMVVQNLLREKDDDIQVIKGVGGLKWGNYVGSPSKPTPTIVWNNFHSSPVALLVPLITNDVFGLPEQTSLLLSYSKERSVNLVNEGITLLGAALLSWGHLDGIVRIKERKEQPQIPFIFCPPKDPVSVCSTTPDCPYIWIGLTSGNILVFKYTFNAENGGVDVDPEPITLLGHKKKINNIYLSHAFGIAVSVSEDEITTIWDLNELIYIRSIDSDKLPVKLVAVSDTLGDIATVCYDDNNETDCLLRLHTVNATLVRTMNICIRVTALCFSTAPEGVSVNVIATGHSNGMISLWSTWNFLPVRNIMNESTDCSVIGITYSYDSQHLYASYSDGNVFIWETANSNGTIKTPKFLNLTTVNNYSH